jgi:hypothetical protein
MWSHFDINEVHEDLTLLSEIGINLAQVVLPWQVFQPGPTEVRCAALAHLMELCDAAASERIRLELMLFSGDPASGGGMPTWLTSNVVAAEPDSSGVQIDTHVSPLARAEAKQAASMLIRAIVRVVGNHPALWAYSLGDRLSELASSSDRTLMNDWIAGLQQTLCAVDQRHPVTCSLSGKDLFTNSSLRVDQLASFLHHSTIDCSQTELGAICADPAVCAAFCCRLVSALTAKPCLPKVNQTPTSKSELAALGASEPQLTHSLLNRLHQLGALGTLLGFDEQGADDSGNMSHICGIELHDACGSISPSAEAIREFTRTKPQLIVDSTNWPPLGMTPDEYYGQPSMHIPRLYQEFLAGQVTALPQ